jgi:hypothetical protein
VLRGRWFAAIEVSTSANKERLFRLADHADLVVVPDDLDVRVAMDGTPVAHLGEAHAATQDLATSRLKPFGASAVLIREAARLRPYVLLAKRARVDPSVLSRLSAYLDSRDLMMLGTSDRVITETLPAHLDGAMASRSARWAEQHYEELEGWCGSALRERAPSASADIAVGRAGRAARPSLVWRTRGPEQLVCGFARP